MHYNELESTMMTINLTILLFQNPPIRARLDNPSGLGDHRPRADQLQLQL